MVARGLVTRSTLPGLVALCVAVALAFDLITLKLVGFDLAAYILAARRLVYGEPLYQTTLTALGPFGQFVYPPFAVLPFVPIALLPFDVARGAGLIALVSLDVIVAWRLSSELPPATRYWGAAAVVLFFPMIWEVTLENLTLVTLACCLLSWHLRDRPFRSGVMFAIALGLKLLPLSLIAYLAAAGRPRVLAWSAAILGAVVALSWPVVGSEWPTYLTLLAQLAGSPGTGSNIVPVIFAAPALRPVLPALAVAIALLAGAIARMHDHREQHAFRVGLTAVPLVASTLWYPYLIFALPLLVASAPSPRITSLRLPFRVARPAIWLLMQLELIRDPGREFLLPFIALLLLLAVGSLELSFASAPVAVRKELAAA